MYEKFYDELFESGKFAIHQIHEGRKYVLVRNKDRMLDCPKNIVVIYANDSDISLSLIFHEGLFEHMGMLCRHILKVVGYMCSLFFLVLFIGAATFIQFTLAYFFFSIDCFSSCVSGACIHGQG